MAETGSAAVHAPPHITPKLKRRLISLAIAVTTFAAAAVILYPVVTVVLGVFDV